MHSLLPKRFWTFTNNFVGWRFLRLFSAVLVAGSAASCMAVPPDPKPVGIAAPGYRLVKDWDFKSRIRDIGALQDEFFTRYVYANGTLDHVGDEWSRYRNNDNHVFTRSGLSLVAKIGKSLSPGGVESGMLRSKWHGKYGIFEVKMKVPAGRGMWPAFWLNPEDGKWPPEIDVVEIVNNGRDTSSYSFHYLHGKATQQRSVESSLDKFNRYPLGADYSDDFHVFSVEWTPTEVTHYVDGKLIVRRQFSWVREDRSDAGDAHVLLNLAVGGAWPGPPSEANLPASLEIAYIRVFQKQKLEE